MSANVNRGWDGGYNYDSTSIRQPFDCCSTSNCSRRSNRVERESNRLRVKVESYCCNHRLSRNRIYTREHPLVKFNQPPRTFCDCWSKFYAGRTAVVQPTGTTAYIAVTQILGDTAAYRRVLLSASAKTNFCRRDADDIEHIRYARRLACYYRCCCESPVGCRFGRVWRYPSAVCEAVTKTVGARDCEYSPWPWWRLREVPDLTAAPLTATQYLLGSELRSWASSSSSYGGQMSPFSEPSHRRCWSDVGGRGSTEDRRGEGS